MNFSTPYYAYEGGRLVRAGRRRYGYDARGRLAARRGPEGETGFLYNGQDRMERVLLPDGRVLFYGYDPDGHVWDIRPGMVQPGASGPRPGNPLFSFSWPQGRLTEVHRNRFQRLALYHYEEGSLPVACEMQGKTYRLHYDQVGSLLAMSEWSSGLLAKVLRYDTFGNIIGANRPDLPLFLGFASGLHDPFLGLIHMGFREYDPDIARFTRPDPLGITGPDQDVYEYCLDDAVNFVDPLGLQATDQELLDSSAQERMHIPEQDAVVEEPDAGKEKPGNATLPVDPMLATPKDEKPDDRKNHSCRSRNNLKLF